MKEERLEEEELTQLLPVVQSWKKTCRFDGSVLNDLLELPVCLLQLAAISEDRENGEHTREESSAFIVSRSGSMVMDGKTDRGQSCVPAWQLADIGTLQCQPDSIVIVSFSKRPCWWKSKPGEVVDKWKSPLVSCVEENKHFLYSLQVNLCNNFFILEIHKPSDKMSSPLQEESAETQSSDELECKICYNRYNLRQRKPKVLECCHRVCAKCLCKIIDFGESPQGVIVCPFCRFETCLPDDEVSSLPDDNNILLNLACGGKGKKCLPDNPTELLLTPKRLASLVSPSHTSSNCLVITIMEVQRESPQTLNSTPVVEFYRPTSFDSVATVSHNWTVWNCTSLLFQTSIRVLVWLLGLLYFSSLPLGIYLLVSKKVTLGVVFVSLVPSSLVILMVYGFCQCVCHEFLDCMSS
ncbi:UNVERIFIED_CONTAM: hypothetical protein H355_008003 [Colinus virginianus]|nr:hypothetical protein H355_008003 [Colinus virginianus]